MMLCFMTIGLHLTSTEIVNKRMHDIINHTYMNAGKVN
jgi:hypothetical protein